ncbi:hypothetical protein DAPPUDRAFT_244271 [Daphnia pulex]|uniref:RanBP2-type domain-containing protein n=1 Tax=Daphnia pulex TaxID=6669 RepID=E9GKK8_DAPPU|nr:hypothetical protein DAPPUDRAFT_244271 [Daphnia pulex]|eukprot:EFX80009.1 hypothetical protein DAPPUDRAFT_244271 [Daphnia pulex]
MLVFVRWQMADNAHVINVGVKIEQCPSSDVMEEEFWDCFKCGSKNNRNFKFCQKCFKCGEEEEEFEEEEDENGQERYFNIELIPRNFSLRRTNKYHSSRVFEATPFDCDGLTFWWLAVLTPEWLQSTLGVICCFCFMLAEWTDRMAVMFEKGTVTQYLIECRSRTTRCGST